MSAKVHPDLINRELSAEAKNGLRLAGFNLNDVGPDRPVSPDGHKIIIGMWEAGQPVEAIMAELKLSEERTCAELLFLSMKGRIRKRKSALYMDTSFKMRIINPVKKGA